DEHDDEPAAGPILQPPDAVVRHDDLRSPSRMKSSPTSAYSTQQAAAPMAAQESCGLKLPSSASPARIASPKTIIQTPMKASITRSKRLWGGCSTPRVYF